MNTRRKMFSGLVLAAAALLALSGCKKDEGEKVVLSAEFEQPAGGQKTYINDHSVRWTSGDEVLVGGTEGAVVVSDGAVEVTANNNGYAVAYPFEGSTLSGSGSECAGGMVVIPADQAYATTEGGQQKMSSPMAARLDASSGRLYFKNLHSLIRVDVTTGNEDFVLESITITSSTANLAGTLGFGFKNGGTTADAASAPELGSLTDAKKSVTLNFSKPLTLAAHTIDKAFYLCVAPFTNTNLKIKVTGTPQGGTYAGKKGSYVFNRSGKSLNRSIMAEVKADFADAAFKPEPFKFSVRADLQVEFSPGNLQYLACNSTAGDLKHQTVEGEVNGMFRFAEHQWDYIGNAAGNNTASDRDKQSDWIDLFGWGTSGWNNGNAFYQPYDNSNATSGAYTSSNGYGYGPTDSKGNYLISLTEDYANADWGVYNAIYNPKTKSTDAAGTWRTLTIDEWDYLIKTRTKASDLCKTGVTVCDKSNCLIIAPDGFTGTIDASYDASAWSAAEAAGLVCLPAAGSRNGASVGNAGSFGNYWSSTSGVNYLYFFSSIVSTFVDNSRYFGYSVRLVKNVK